MSFPTAPGVTLTPVQVAVTELLKRLGVAGSLQGGLNLSNAIVPTLDITAIFGLAGPAQAAPLDKRHTNTGIGPHGLTSRLSYTVPAGKRAQLVNGTVLTIVQTAGAGGTRRNWFSITRASSGLELFVLVATHTSQSVGAMAISQLEKAIDLYPGDIVQCKTGDDGAGGTSYYEGYFTVNEQAG